MNLKVNNLLKPNKMKKYLFKFLLIAVMIQPAILTAQTSSGKCWYLDYDLWCDAEYPDIHGNCGASEVFNPGDNFTMEAWVRSYTFGLNMKILGLTTPSFDNGYVMGFENMNIYSEIFNPDNQSVSNTGNGPIPVDSAWIHIATTYSSSGDMVNYLNGVEVGRTTVFPQNPISNSDAPFIIGRAPWDFAWAFNGGIDEIRLWNIQKTGEEIQELMFKELQGYETGLLAYYNFNNPTDETFYDLTSNGNDGTINNYTEECFWWKESFAPVGNENMYEMNDIIAAWSGKVSTQHNYALTENGFSVIANGIGEKDFWKYVVFGHDNSTGISTEDAPTGNPADFERLSRIWYVNQAGNDASQLIFNIEEATGGGVLLTSVETPENYTLLYREETTGEFEAICSANSVNGYYVVFDWVNLEDGYYSMCYTSEQIADPATKIENLSQNFNVKTYPNPAKDFVSIKNGEGYCLKVFTITGKEILQKEIKSDIEEIDIQNLKKGIYLFVFSNTSEIKTEKIIIK